MLTDGKIDAVVRVSAGDPVVVLDRFPGVADFCFEPSNEIAIGGAEPQVWGVIVGDLDREF